MDAGRPPPLLRTDPRPGGFHDRGIFDAVDVRLQARNALDDMRARNRDARLCGRLEEAPLVRNELERFERRNGQRTESPQTALIHAGLDALIARASAQRLADLGGQFPTTTPGRRRRSRRAGR